MESKEQLVRDKILHIHHENKDLSHRSIAKTLGIANSGNLFFTAKDKFSIPEHVRTQKMSKFAKKFLVWQAICTCGKRSAPFVTQDTMNGQVYMKECLQKRLLPLLKAHNVPTIFWPDLASCHYSKDVLKWYADNKVNFVPKMFNPPNTPELRPIEKYWAIMKQHLLKRPKVVKTVEELKKVWVYMQKTVDSQVVQNLMAGVKAKVRAFAY